MGGRLWRRSGYSANRIEVAGAAGDDGRRIIIPQKSLSASFACYTLSVDQTISLTKDTLVDSKVVPQNIQDGFLNLARREKTTVTIYLVNGAKLLGRIKSFDKFSLLLETGSTDQLIFKHAISTISQARRATGELRHAPNPSENPEPASESPSA